MPTPANPFDLSGRVALVTGGGRGLGLAMARAMAAAGARVYVNGRDAAALEACCSAAQADGLSLFSAAFDVSDVTAGLGAIAQIAESEGRFDILVNNVGQRLRAAIEDTGPEEMRSMLETNVTAAYALARGAAAQMKRNGYGRIIMLSSSAAIRARAGDVAYITAKGAVESMTRALACEWAREGVLTNAIAPGPFATETNAAYVNDPALLAGLVSRSPVERWGQPDEIGPACVFLASPAASYINGVVLPVDGGITIHY